MLIYLVNLSRLFLHMNHILQSTITFYSSVIQIYVKIYIKLIKNYFSQFLSICYLVEGTQYVAQYRALH